MSERDYRVYDISSLKANTKEWLSSTIPWVTLYEMSSRLDGGPSAFTDHWVLCYNTDEDHAVLIHHGADFEGLFQGDDVLGNALDQTHTYAWLWARATTVKGPEEKPTHD